MPGFAEVYLALKLHARLQAGGSLIPLNGAPAGFTVNFRYGYAYIYGAGVHGYVDFEFPDAAAVVDAVVRTQSSSSTNWRRTMRRRR